MHRDIYLRGRQVPFRPAAHFDIIYIYEFKTNHWFTVISNIFCYVFCEVYRSEVIRLT